MELGCNRGYLLASFLEHETFNAIGADHQEKIGFGGNTFRISRAVRGFARVPIID